MLRPSVAIRPIGKLEQLGQSVWLDYIHREMLESGELKRMIEEHGVRGVTSNPTIFEQAIGGSAAYDAALAELARQGQDARAISEALAVEDIQRAADLFEPIFQMSGGADGFVSFEVAPTLADDAAATVAEARRLWSRIGRPNLMIKIPGTSAGLPAVTQAIADGINVNITLLFSVAVYERVVDAYVAGLERRRAAGQALETVHSVASFFVSRVDTEVDSRLEGLIAGTADPGEQERLRGLLGTAAVANARIAYEKFAELFTASRFRRLMAHGATVQRPLWASTSTKNPRYRDTLYVDSLIGPDTVNTMPPATLRAFSDHGIVARTIDADLDGARRVLADIGAAGIDLGEATDLLTRQGVRKFADSYHALLAAVEAKRSVLAT